MGTHQFAGRTGRLNRVRRERLAAKFEEELNRVRHTTYLSETEKADIGKYSNQAAHLLDRQSQAVQLLFENKAINLTQQVTIQEAINSFYEAQGKAERIKRFPFPRKYASFSFIFVCIFVFLLPFGIVQEFGRLPGALVWMSVPVGVIIGWCIL